MGIKAFKFNSKAKYHPGLQHVASHDVGDLRKGRVYVQADDPQKWFEAKYPDIFENYPLKVSSEKQVQAWRSTPMQFWQNQLNFAIWCATTGCGVSVEDHLSSTDVFLQSFFRFHVYYQIRRILKEVGVPLPYDKSWDMVNNSYDRGGYERICREFVVSPHSDWKVSGFSWGLGRAYMHNIKNGQRHSFVVGEYDPSRLAFAESKQNPVFLLMRPHIDYIKQDAAGADKAWKSFILNISNGFTRPGVGRLNESIRTYVWAILGAQGQTRTNILGAGEAIDAQKQFLANVEDAINSPVDIPSSITRYQEVLQYARSEVNFIFGEGLYMAPGDMRLRVGKIAGYNNKIIIATGTQNLGLNKGLNKGATPPDAANDTGEKGLVIPMGADSPSEATTSQSGAKPTPATTTAAAKADHEAHEDEKTALIVGSIAIGLGLLWFLR